METQFDNQEFAHAHVHELIQEIITLRNEVQTLKIQNKILLGQKFVTGYFMNNRTLEYLEKCSLNREAVCRLLNIIERLDFSCTKYLIDCWTNGLYDWNEKFFDVTHKRDKTLIQFVCGRCYGSILDHNHVETILYILNIYDERNLNLCENMSGMTLMHMLCGCGESRTINRILDIYVGKNLDLERVDDDNKMTPLHLLCRYGDFQTINRMIDICVEKNLNLAPETKQGNTPLYLSCVSGMTHIIKRMVRLYNERGYNLQHVNRKGENYLYVACKRGKMEIVKFMMDLYAEKKFSFAGNNGLSIDQMLHTNTHLRKNTSCMCMYMCELEKCVFQSM